MVKEIILNGRKIEYTLEYKAVKNINLRIKADGKVYVSANRRVKADVIEGFMQSKSDFILNALNKFASRTLPVQTAYFTEDEIKAYILSLCDKAYPYYEKLGIKYPVIRFRKMVSCWGTCNPPKGILNFNTNLMLAPPECVEYVVWHEFTHFLQANHSAKFYNELSKVCPDWQEKRKMLKGIVIRKND